MIFHKLDTCIDNTDARILSDDSLTTCFFFNFELLLIFVTQMSGVKRPREESNVDDGAEKGAMSIEETNAMRAKLGLKPLGAPAGGTAEDKAQAKKERADAAAEAAREAAAAEAADRLERARNKRLLTAKVVKGQSLGDALANEDDSAAAFIKRSRKADARRAKEKALAERRARELAEQEEQETEAYSGRDLKGLSVAHDADAFAAGETRILTLADRGVLDET